MSDNVLAALLICAYISFMLGVVFGIYGERNRLTGPTVEVRRKACRVPPWDVPESDPTLQHERPGGRGK